MVLKRNSRWKRKSSAESFKAIPVSEDAVHRAADEGLLIARFAVVMDVKNHIIVGALRHDSPFDVDALSVRVQDTLARLSTEQAAYASRVTDVLRARAASARGSVKHEHDYHPEDLGSLDLRHAVYSRVAEDLKRCAHDPDYVAEIVEKARQDAWAELGEAVEVRLDHLPIPPVRDAEYEQNRERRLRQLVDVDLAALGQLMNDI